MDPVAPPMSAVTVRAPTKPIHVMYVALLVVIITPVVMLLLAESGITSFNYILAPLVSLSLYVAVYNPWTVKNINMPLQKTLGVTGAWYAHAALALLGVTGLVFLDASVLGGVLQAQA